MRDRGTLIAGAGVALAFIVAAIAFLYLRTADASRRAEEARLQSEMLREEAERERTLDPKRESGKRAETVDLCNKALERGLELLCKKQSPDGAWRSDTYATFKSGMALTPLVVTALQDSGDAAASEAVRKGCDYLAKHVKPDGSIEGANGDLDYPVYTAALSVVALSHPDQKKHVKARDFYVKFLLSHQLTEQNGWKPEDKPYGGWGYCRLVPKKPEPGAIAPPLVESNLSATVFALEALKAAGVNDKDVYSKALGFVRRRQNADGGFHFIYDDPVRNKGGIDRSPRAPEGTFNSYGSTTADGLRALRLCGEMEVSNLDRAQGWLGSNFRADSHPGTYVLPFEPNRHAVYYYYTASVAKALRAEKVDRAGGVEWAHRLAAELAKRQNPDGSWVNHVDLVRENEPLVATANALIALANCKAAVSVAGKP